MRDEYYLEDLDLIDRCFGLTSDWTYRLQFCIQITFLIAWLFTLKLPYFFLLCILFWVFELVIVLKLQTTMSLFILQSGASLHERTRSMFLSIANIWAQGYLGVYGLSLLKRSGLNYSFESLLGLFCVTKVLLIFVYLFGWHCTYISRGFTLCYECTSGIYDFFRTNPIRRFVQRNRAKSVNEDDEPTCAICLKEFTNESTMKIPECGHRFHEDCISRWLMIKYQCPLCKGCVEVNSEESPLIRHSPLFGGRNASHSPIFGAQFSPQSRSSRSPQDTHYQALNL